jgi:RDD family
MELRRFVPLAPLPGAVLAVSIYGLDPSYGSGGYPSHQWSTVGVIAGWSLLLLGLSFVGPSLVTRWMALAAALCFVAGPVKQGSGEIALYALGFVLTAALIVVTSAMYVVTTQDARGRVVWSLGLTALGGAALISFGYPYNPFLDHPATQVLATLVLTPGAVAFGALWLWLDRPSTLDPAKNGEPAGFARRFVAGFVSLVIFSVAGSLVAATAPAFGALIYLICFVLLQVLPTALWGRTVGQLSARVRVVRVDNGERPGWLRSIVRSAVFQTAPLVGLIYFVTWGTNVRIGFGRGVPERLAWDRASGTAVVREPRPALAAPSIVRT